MAEAVAASHPQEAARWAQGAFRERSRSPSPPSPVCATLPTMAGTAPQKWDRSRAVRLASGHLERRQYEEGPFPGQALFRVFFFPVGEPSVFRSGGPSGCNLEVTKKAGYLGRRRHQTGQIGPSQPIRSPPRAHKASHGTRSAIPLPVSGPAPLVCDMKAAPRERRGRRYGTWRLRGWAACRDGTPMGGTAASRPYAWAYGNVSKK